MNIENVSAQSQEKAVSFLHAGKLVAFATETVYGLGADATNDKAVAEIFAVKGRPQFNPLIVHVDGVSMAKKFAVWNARADKLSEAFWPGPLTLVLKRKEDCSVSLLASAGGDTLALRMPDHVDARALITLAGVPLAAPSANRSGRVSPTRAQHVKDELAGDVPLILDSGACSIGIESTVVDISGATPLLLRPGSVMKEQIETALGEKLGSFSSDSATLKSPGLLLQHYAPSIPVRLNVMLPKADEALLAFGANVPAGAAKVINLSEAGDLKEAASNLFVSLRALDNPQYKAIAVMLVPNEGIGIAINDRLKRAAARG